MTVGSGAASYGGGAALMNLVQAAAAEHGIVIGSNTAILIGLGVGLLIHYVSNKMNPQQPVAATETDGVLNALKNITVEQPAMQQARPPVQQQTAQVADVQPAVPTAGGALGPKP